MPPPSRKRSKLWKSWCKAGKVRFPAISNYAAWQVAEILCICEKRGYHPYFISQPMYNLIARGIEEEYLPFCRRFGVAVVPYNPLAGGLLTGKHSRQSGPTPGTRFDGNKMYQDRYWLDDDFAAVEELRSIAAGGGQNPGGTGASVAALPTRRRFHHPGSFAAGATPRKPEGRRRRPAGYHPSWRAATRCGSACAASHLSTIGNFSDRSADLRL